MDSVEIFIQKLENEFDEIPSGSLTPETDFRMIGNWSSMHALIIIALIDSEYDILLSGQELRTVNTIQELYNLISNKAS